ncbi:MAG: hypothetical protein V4720_06380 [Pseudomonadota bacterium]
MMYAPPSPNILAAARKNLLDPSMVTPMDKVQRAAHCTVNFGILRDAREARLGPRAAATGPALIVSLAAFPARRRPRLIVAASGPTPGDAA